MKVLFGTAIRIAQALGLDRLGPDQTEPVFDNQALIEREVEKRVWSYLCCQDWFGAGTVNGITTPTIFPIHMNTPMPANCPERLGDTILWGRINNLALEYATQSTYQIMMYKLAIIMQDFHMKTWDMQPDSKDFLFEVLTADGRINGLFDTAPIFLTRDLEPEDSRSPPERSQSRMFKMCVAHKLLVIHQALFLSSFKNEVYTYTRQSCLRHSKSILREYTSKPEWEDEAWSISLHVTMAAAVFSCIVFDSFEPCFPSDLQATPGILADVNARQLLLNTRDKFCRASAKRGGTMAVKCIELLEQLTRLLDEHRTFGGPVAGSDVSDIPSLIIARVGAGRR